MGLTESFSGSATSYAAGNGDLTSSITAGSTDAILSVKNTSDVPIKFHFRQTGSSDDENRDISPGEYKQITVKLTSARTIDYYIEGGGSVTVYAVLSIGSGLVVSTVTVADIRTTLLDSGYLTPDISDAAIQGYIDIISAEVTDAATRHANIAGFALNVSIKTNAIKLGSLAKVLQFLRNKGWSRGLESGSARVSNDTEETWFAEYQAMLAGIQSGIKYGA